MTHLVVKETERVQKQLPKFIQLLEVYDLKLISQQPGSEPATLELIIDTSFFQNVRWVITIAQECFDTDLISYQTNY